MTCHELTLGALLLGARPLRDCTDYSEEAIPERDPAYRGPDGTLLEAQTVDALLPEVRLALRRQLEQLGMKPARAAALAAL